MKFTFYGHSCFSIEVNGTKLLFDPFISGNPKASHIDISTIEADYILISHGHGDHIADAVALAKQTGATCISSYEVVNWLGTQGADKGHPMNIGGGWNFEFGRVKMVNALHSSSFPDGSYAGPAAGFVVSAGEKTFYFAGDTDLMHDMKRWGRDYEFDFLILPIGDNFTMDYKSAARASKWMKCKQVIGVHFDTFPYVEIEHEKAKAAFADKGAELHLLDIGASMEI